MLQNLLKLLENPAVLIGIAVLVFMNWDRIKPWLDKLRGSTDANPSPSVADTVREALADWLHTDAIGNKLPAVDPDSLTLAESALDDAVHNWLRLRRGAKDTAALDELFKTFPATYLEPTAKK